MQSGALSWRGGSPTSLKGRKGPKASPIKQSTSSITPHCCPVPVRESFLVPNVHFHLRSAL